MRMRLSLNVHIRWPFLGFVLITSLYTYLPAQDHNGKVYQQLLNDYMIQNPQTFKTIQGRPVNDWLPNISIDSSVSRILQIGRAEIEYNKVGHKIYSRSISLNIVLQDSQLQSEVLSFSDTLSGSALRAIIKKSPELLKGEDPTLLSRWIKPASLIAGSILSIVALFYVRSQ